MKTAIHTQIMHGVNLTCVSAYQFKTGCLSMTLLTRLDKKTVALNAVLPSVLRRGTARLPDTLSIQAELDGLYGARIEPVVRRKGEVQCVGFLASFLDDAFVPGRQSVFSRTARLMGEMLLSPVTSGGRLRGDYVAVERENLMDAIRAEINDKRIYSINRLVDIMCRGERYGVSRNGTLADAGKISVATLTKQYRQLLAGSRLEVFYCGSAEPAEVERTVREALSALPRAAELEGCSTDVLFTPKGSRVRKPVEEMDVTQANLAMGFRMGQAARKAGPAALMILNAVYGGSATSKLFLNVRERLSLCYYASSYIDRHKGVMVVSSGIDPEKCGEAGAEILAQLEAVKNGDVEPWEFDSARHTVVSALSSAMDSMGRIEDMYLDRTVSGMTYLPEDLAAMALDVTLEDVVKAAGDIKLDTVYLLTKGAAEDGT